MKNGEIKTQYVPREVGISAIISALTCFNVEIHKLSADSEIDRICGSIPASVVSLGMTHFEQADAGIAQIPTSLGTYTVYNISRQMIGS